MTPDDHRDATEGMNCIKATMNILFALAIAVLLAIMYWAIVAHK